MSQFHRAHPQAPHPFAHELRGGSSYTQDERDEAESERYCGCNEEPTIEEIDSGTCDACGKEIL